MATSKTSMKAKPIAGKAKPMKAGPMSRELGPMNDGSMSRELGPMPSPRKGSMGKKVPSALPASQKIGTKEKGTIQGPGAGGQVPSTQEKGTIQGVRAGRDGNIQNMEKVAKAAAAEAGLLPHEWLLLIARGEPIPHKQWRLLYDAEGNEIGRELVQIDYYADFPTRVDAAKSAAPYYAAKKTQQIVSNPDGTPIAGNVTNVNQAVVFDKDEWAEMAKRINSEV